MSYLQDRKIKRKKTLSTVAILFFVFIFLYFRNPLFSGFSFLGNTTLRPVLVLKNSINNIFSSMGGAFSFKNSLIKENEKLSLKLIENNLFLLNYQSVLKENIELKEILNRKKNNTEMLVSAILSKPNVSPYDTIIVDVGESAGVEEGSLVFALGDIPIGRIFDVYPNSAKVVLFSSAGDKTEVVMNDKNISMQIVGRGGGNFEMIIPRDFVLEEGSTVSLPGISSYIVAIVETVVSDPRDSFTKVLLSSPVNIQELKFVEIAL